MCYMPLSTFKIVCLNQKHQSEKKMFQINQSSNQALKHFFPQPTVFDKTVENN